MNVRVPTWMLRLLLWLGLGKNLHVECAGCKARLYVKTHDVDKAGDEAVREGGAVRTASGAVLCPACAVCT